ncbi:hypothetical protein ACF0H5_021492 [Mactra antiquata]
MSGKIYPKVLILFTVIFIFYISDVTNGSFILPNMESATVEPPICTSLNSLCGLNYRYVTNKGKTIMDMHSDQEICTCPEDTRNNCSVSEDWDNMNNSLVQRLLSGPGNQLLVKISYCQLPVPKQDCRLNDPVLVTRGRGHLMFQLVNDMMCKCDRPLMAQSSWIHGEYDYVMYGCGQPRCAKRNATVCAELTYDEGSLKTHSFCRCKRQEMCKGDLPKSEGETIPHKCVIN